MSVRLFCLHHRTHGSCQLLARAIGASLFCLSSLLKGCIFFLRLTHTPTTPSVGRQRIFWGQIYCSHFIIARFFCDNLLNNDAKGSNQPPGNGGQVFCCAGNKKKPETKPQDESGPTAAGRHTGTRPEWTGQLLPIDPSTESD